MGRWFIRHSTTQLEKALLFARADADANMTMQILRRQSQGTQARGQECKEEKTGFQNIQSKTVHSDTAASLSPSLTEQKKISLEILLTSLF